MKTSWWALLLGLGLGLGTSVHAEDDWAQALQQLEKKQQARIGLALVDEQGNVVRSHRADERFALCSTFKLPLAALTLQRMDAGRERAERRLTYDDYVLDAYAPVARRYLSSGYMTVSEAMQAALQLSDNTAANLLLQAAGGPAAMTAYFRKLGDEVSRLDRTEPDLNSNVAGDERDSSTPQAMAQTTAKLVLGSALTPNSRRQLQRWLMGNQTGDKAIRAALPTAWQSGDKTGSCEKGGRNDVAFFVTEKGQSFVLAIYTVAPRLNEAQRDELLVQAARQALQGLP